VIAALAARLWRVVSRKIEDRPRLVWAGVPVLSLSNASLAMEQAGYMSISISSARYHTMEEADFDQFVPSSQRYPKGCNSVHTLIRGALIFSKTLFSYDILHGLFNGAILGKTSLVDWEYRLWKLAGGKLVIMPYGGDAFIYAELPDKDWAEALRKVYPRSKREDEHTAWRVKTFSRKADAVVGCIVHDVCLPRSDYLPVLWYPAPLHLPAAAPKFLNPRPVQIVHPTNHRSIKGTDILVAAVSVLEQEGFAVELDVVEKTNHAETLQRLARADIVVDQLLFGYGLTALEGMAMAKPVVTGISKDPMYAHFREHSWLDEAPLISANSKSIIDTLRNLVSNPTQLYELGLAHRSYAETFHSNETTVALFEQIYADIDLKT
jgi:glycosyltransferase involved in cell wall biosynthesis